MTGRNALEVLEQWLSLLTDGQQAPISTEYERAQRVLLRLRQLPGLDNVAGSVFTDEAELARVLAYFDVHIAQCDADKQIAVVEFDEQLEDSLAVSALAVQQLAASLAERVGELERLQNAWREAAHGSTVESFQLDEMICALENDTAQTQHDSQMLQLTGATDAAMTELSRVEDQLTVAQHKLDVAREQPYAYHEKLHRVNAMRFAELSTAQCTRSLVDALKPAAMQKSEYGKWLQQQ